MASVEHVFHPIVCDACGRDSFTGFRYKCQRCHNYQLCQDCFWRGRVSSNHNNQHEMKEYSSYKSPTKQLSHSIGKSLQCAPAPTNRKFDVSEIAERPLDLSNVVPSSPSLVRTHFKRSPEMEILDGAVPGSGKSYFPSPNFDDSMDDEHRLIARYTAKLSGRSTYHPVMINVYEDHFEQKATIAHLEKKNREIMREISRLQAMQSATSLSALSSSANAENGISTELENLRLRKVELESRMQQLQNTRKDLLVQLEGLMKVLKNQNVREGSPRSLQSFNGNEVRTRDMSSLSDSDKPCSPYATQNRSVVQTASPSSTYGSMRKTSLQTDLLSAVDSITNTMTSLVQELNPDLENESQQEQACNQLHDQPQTQSIACSENGS